MFAQIAWSGYKPKSSQCLLNITITFREETYVKRFPGAAQVSFDLHYSPPLYGRVTVLPRKKGQSH